MGAEIYHNDCKACAISRRIEEPCRGGGIIELDGNWILNHYGGDEGFLGWMALQPRFHRMELTDLNSDEANALGKNIQKIDLALRQYWAIKFPTDPVRRVYVVYFFESAFEKSCDKYHLHIHLIPRTERFSSLSIRIEKTQGIEKVEDGVLLIAWNIHQLRQHHDFTPMYQIREENEKNKRKVEALMNYLRGQLHRLS
jgi:diadenosine tetraphosphate (Ap4A) HIT family hydrolase